MGIVKKATDKSAFQNVYGKYKPYTASQLGAGHEDRRADYPLEVIVAALFGIPVLAFGLHIAWSTIKIAICGLGCL